MRDRLIETRSSGREGFSYRTARLLVDDRHVPASDLSDLAAQVRSSPIVLDNGEVMWPFDAAADAINELARSGRVILGVDARERHDAGLVTEVGTYQFI